MMVFCSSEFWVIALLRREKFIRNMNFILCTLWPHAHQQYASPLKYYDVIFSGSTSPPSNTNTLTTHPPSSSFFIPRIPDGRGGSGRFSVHDGAPLPYEQAGHGWHVEGEDSETQVADLPAR